MKLSLIPAALTGIALLSACSGISSSQDRSPSSIHTLGDGAGLHDLVISRNPRAESRAFVSRLLRMQLRAHGWMLETDRLFNAASLPVNLFDQASYRKLMVARPMIELSEHKIASLYAEAHAGSLNSSDDDRSRETANQSMLVVAGIRDALLEARKIPAHRVLLNDLMLELESRDSAAFFKPLRGEELFSAAASMVPDVEKLISDLPSTDEVKEQVEHEEGLLQDAMKSEGMDREPNSVSIFPSVGPGGNVDGFGFPRGTWAITYDDGPHEIHTEQELANLKATGLKATFFWLAKNILLYPNIVKKVQAAGMPVENHSYTHATETSPFDLLRLSTNLDREINVSTAIDTKYYGVRPRFFRCPYGAGFKDPVIRGMIAKQGMVHVRWNVDSLDWKDKNPASVLARVQAQMAVNGRGIILFHDIQPSTVIASRKLMDLYKSKVRFVTIPQIVDEINGVRH